MKAEVGGNLGSRQRTDQHTEQTADKGNNFEDEIASIGDELDTSPFLPETKAVQNRTEEMLRHYKIMRNSSEAQLCLMTHCRSTLEALAKLVEQISKEQDSFSKDITERDQSHKSKVVRLIETSIDLQDKISASNLPDERENKQQQLEQTRLELVEALDEWSPVPYLVNKFLPDQMHKLPEDDDSCDFCKILGDMRTRSEQYINSRNSLANRHLMLVHSISNKFRYLGLPYEDLFQEGFIGLLKAVERYQPEKGFQFSTYAHRVIGQSIHLALDKQTYLVRKPYRFLREKATVDAVRKKGEQELGRPLRAHELGEKLPDNLEDKANHIQENTSVTADSESLWSINPREFDVETKDLDAEELELQITCSSEHLDKAIRELDQRSQYILRMRYGIGINRVHTLSEISQNLSLSSERVRQIALKAIESLSIKFQTH